MGKTVILLGGPNGAGKTTLARPLLLERLPDAFAFLNADFIAEGLSPFKPQKVAWRAGKVFMERFDRLSEAGDSFVVESTLSGRSLASRLAALRARGYRVEIIYLWLPSAKVAKQRVEERARLGGHRLAADVVERRFAKSYPNFLERYLSLADKWTLLDGSATPPRALARSGRSRGFHLLVEDHVACLQLVSAFRRRDAVEETVPAYGVSGKFYTDDLQPILERVEEYLEDLEKGIRLRNWNLDGALLRQVGGEEG